MAVAERKEEVGAQAALVRTLLEEIREFCAANADPQLVVKYSRYFTEGYDAYGVPDKVLHAKREEWFNNHYEQLGLEGFLDLSDLLWQSGKYEEGFVAINFVSQLKERYTAATLDRIGRWFDQGWIRNWAHCDVLTDVLEEFVTAKIVPLEAFAPWRESPAKFKRRAVPVTLLGLRKKTHDYKPLFDFIRPLMLDSERVVHQGLGWFLREAWKLQPDQVEPFLLEYKDVAPRLIFQYATEKMTPEQKVRFRRRR